MIKTLSPGRLYVFILAASLAAAAARAETVQDLEAVDTNGFTTWAGSFPFIITGVLLNDPSEMLDSTPDFLPWDDGANAYDLGGQWQVFVQTVSPGDRGGVECWMGQNYGNLPWEPHDGSDSYSNLAWSNEVVRVSHGPATGYLFHKGDLVTVTANGALFYGGMENINEEHRHRSRLQLHPLARLLQLRSPPGRSDLALLGHQHQPQPHGALRHL